MYVIKSKDGYYLRRPGNSLSSRYDDDGYSTRDIEYAVHFKDSLEYVQQYGFHSTEGSRFSRENARVVKVKLVEVTTGE